MQGDMPTFGSLFAGIGGIDLGLERAGWECRFQVEWDEWCQRVLARHWPDIKRYGDITAVDWSTVEPVDLLAGGFPCQPFSFAGQRRGKSDDRWLWPAFATAIRHLRPRYVLVENVPGLLAGHGGMGAVLGDLADLGYDARWDCIPAAAVGAPHLRYRVWIVAHARSDEHQGGPPADERATAADLLPDTDANELRLQPAGLAGRGGTALAGLDGANRTLADADGRDGGARRPGRPEHGGQGLPEHPYVRASEPLADPDEPGPQGHGRLDREWDRPGEWTPGPGGRSIHRSWLTEPDVGRVAHGVPSRVDRLRGLGNAVVPQVVQVIGERLMDAYRSGD